MSAAGLRELKCIAKTHALPGGELRRWADKKRRSVALATAYARIGGSYARHADQIAGCAPQLLRIGFRGESPDGLDIRTLFAGTCKARLCPTCATLRARRLYMTVVPRFEAALVDNPGVRAAFATFTIPNVPLGDARRAGAGILAGFRRLTQRKAFKRAVLGWMRAMEVTLNRETMMLHPHLHVVLLLRPGYFARDRDIYIPHAEWLRLWQLVMRNPEIEIVDIRALRPRDPERPLSSSLAEITKYPMAPVDLFYRRSGGYVVEPEILRQLHNGLKGKRLFGFGGALRAHRRSADATASEDDGAFHDDEIETLLAEPDPYFVEPFDWTGHHYDRPGAGAEEKRDVR